MKYDITKLNAKILSDYVSEIAEKNKDCELNPEWVTWSYELLCSEHVINPAWLRAGYKFSGDTEPTMFFIK